MAPQTGLSFHAWLFLGGVYTQECVRWLVFPIERNTFDSVCCPPSYDPRSNNQTSTYAWHHRKMVHYLAGIIWGSMEKTVDTWYGWLRCCS